MHSSRMISSTHSFGPLSLSLSFSPAGSLLSISLPPSPPPSLSLNHLSEALAFLHNQPISTPASPKYSAFLNALQNIPIGQTRSYGQLAKQLLTSPRAIGNWCARNQLLLRFPCHRVIAANHLGGFRAGLPWKQILLHLESQFPLP